MKPYILTYLTIYRPETKPLEVTRVLHASRDVKALLIPTD